MFLPPQAQLSISLDDYKTFLEIAKQDEQERIIKLLDDLLVSLNGAYPTDYGLAATLRQLIKGETK